LIVNDEKTELVVNSRLAATYCQERDILGDAYDQGASSEHPHTCHAQLAVILAGTLATFLIDVWESQV
jgi:hypothetical protein